jgi:Reverse transcriptase (RNA-dependent DNA polymerase)
LEEDAYIEYPIVNDNCCLKLKKSLYGLKQAPRTFFEKLKAGLEQRQWKQHDVDPCLFYKSKKLCIVYVHDTIFAGADNNAITEEIKQLQLRIMVCTHISIEMKGKLDCFLEFQLKS